MPSEPPQLSQQQQPPTAATTDGTGTTVTGTFIVKVPPVPGVPPKNPSAFTINILAEGGTATPSSFPGSESGTPVTLTLGGDYDLGINTEPDYNRELGSDCPYGQFTADFTCTITFVYVPSEVPQKPQVSSVGTFIVKVPPVPGALPTNPSDFTIKISAGVGGTATPSSFPGSESGTRVEFSGEERSFNLDINREPGYTRSLGSDCPIDKTLPPEFTCTISFHSISAAAPPPPTPTPSQPPGVTQPTPITHAKFIVEVINDNGGTKKPEGFTINLIVLSGPGTITPSSFPGEGPPGTPVTFKSIGEYSTYGPTPNEDPKYTRTIGPDCPNPGETFPLEFTCTIIFDDIPQKKPFKGIYTVKVKNDNGGTSGAQDVRINHYNTIAGDIKPSIFSGSETGTIVTYTPDFRGIVDTRPRVDDFPLGYSLQQGTDCPSTIPNKDFTCTFTLDDIPALKVIKNVKNDDGHSKRPEDFTIKVRGDNNLLMKRDNNPYSDLDSFQGSSSGTEIRFATEGTYNVTEIIKGSAAGYDTTYSPQCKGSITANSYPPPICTITNDDKETGKGTIVIEKYVLNDNGGTKEPWDFTFSVEANNPVPRNFQPSTQDVVTTRGIGFDRITSTSIQVDEGSYSITEKEDPQYNTYYNLLQSPNSGCSGEIKKHETKYCQIVNDDKPSPQVEIPIEKRGIITVYKNVINDDGGIKQPSNFMITVYLPQDTIRFNGATEGVPVRADSGNYRVDEPPDPYYYTDYSEGCSGIIRAEENRICIITNDDIPQTIIDEFPQDPKQADLRIYKYVINNDGGTKQPSDFIITVNSTNLPPNKFRGSSSGTLLTLQGGPYQVTENLDTNYITIYSGCSGNIIPGQPKICTIINDDKPPFIPGKIDIPTAQTGTLKVIKNIVNNNGGSSQASDFIITISGNNPSPGVFRGVASQQGTTINVGPGPYSVSESEDRRYQTSLSRDCTGVMRTGESKVCVITNNDRPPTTGRLTVIKNVINDNGGTKQPSDFTLTVTGNTPSSNLLAGTTSPGTTISIGPGPYSVTENNPDPRYSVTYSPECSGTIGAGETSICTVTNNDRGEGRFGAQSAIRITDNVINDNGGTKQPSDFTITVTGNTPSPNLLRGPPSPGTIVTLDPGPYDTVQNLDPRYDTIRSADCTGTLGVGENRICGITNNDRPISSFGGGKVGGGAIGGGGGGFGPQQPFGPGGPGPGGPGTAGMDNQTGQQQPPQIIPAGLPPNLQNATLAGQQGKGILTVIKDVINGTKQASDFTITVTGNNPSQPSFSGNSAPGTGILLDPGSYSVSEPSVSAEYRPLYSSDCIGTMGVGENKTCKITNTYKEPSIFGAKTSIIVMKNVINNDTGTKQASDFAISVNGTNPSPNLFVGQSSPNQTIVEIDPGHYKIEERYDRGYNVSYSTGCEGTVNATETKVCIITNDDNLFAADSTPPIALETLKFGRSQFPNNGTIVLADVSPLHVIDGHVLLNLPSNDTNLVAAEVTNAGVEHAVIVPLIKVTGTGKSLYKAELKQSLNGTNPFTNKADTVSSIRELLLSNVNSAGMSFDDDHGATMTLLLSRPPPSSPLLSPTPNTNIDNNSTAIAARGVEETAVVVDLETIKFGRSQFPYNGTIVLADVSPPFHVVGGHILLNLPNNDTNVVAAQITNVGIEHAVIVPSVNVYDTRTGIESLYQVELRPSINGTNPFTGNPDLVTDVTDIILWNNATAGVSFDDDHGTSFTLLMNESSITSSELSIVSSGQNNNNTTSLTNGSMIRNEVPIISSEFSMTNIGQDNNTLTQGSNFLSDINNITSSPTPFSFDLETTKFGSSQFPYNGTIVLADLSPPFQLVGGHVLLNLPSNDTHIVAAQITNSSNGIEHAVIVPSIKVHDTRTGIESLYQAQLKQSPNGTNPFTGNPDLVTDVTDIILWNNATGGVSFDDDSGVTMTLLVNRLSPSPSATAAEEYGMPPYTSTNTSTITTEQQPLPPVSLQPSSPPIQTDNATSTTDLLQQGPCPEGFFINQTTNKCQERPPLTTP
jgi:hypothetical protein